MPSHKHVREVRRLVLEAGLSLVGTRVNGSSHLVCEVRTKAGVTARVVMPSTPSDNRWQKNARSFLNRLAAGEGGAT